MSEHDEDEAPRESKLGVVRYERQVVDEMRKVVYPSRDELRSYTIAVVVFIAFIMAYVNGVDVVVSNAVSWIFGG